MKDIKDKQTKQTKRISIMVSKQLKDKLDKIGKINQSYGELIELIVDWYIKTNKDVADDIAFLSKEEGKK